MTEMETEPSIDALFAGKDAAVLTIYLRLLDRIAVLGPYREEPKETSIHLARTTGFAGIHPQKRALLLNMRTQRPIDSTRVIKCEQVSKDRYHNEIRLTSPNEVDAELNGWLREAYKLG